MTTDVNLLGIEEHAGTMFVDGRWASAQTGGTIDVQNPSDESVIGSVADATIADALAAVDAAAGAADEWAATSPRARAEILRRCWELMTRDSEQLARLISLENGKALSDARGEVAYAAEFFRWYAEEAVRVIGDFSRAPASTNWILVDHKPIGVCVLITPWNFPAAMATRKIAPALAAGCTVVLKPATLTPLTAFALAAIMAEAGVPAGVVNVITTGKSGPVVSAMLDDPRVRKLSFTGSTPVGQTLLRKAADQVLNCSMELGGNAPFIVLEDADLDAAVAGLMVAKMRNGGQACTAANRIFVHREVQAEFAARLAKAMAALAVGPGLDPGTGCGPMIDEAAVSRIHAAVEDAVQGGATVLTGGETPEGPGYFYPPTVLADVADEMLLVQDEIFGPVAAILPFDDDDEVIERANDTIHGLAAYLFAGDLKRGLALSRRLEAGMVGLNRGLVSDPAAPFGGVKQSGLGREGAHHGLLEFTEPQYIAVDW